MKKLRKPSKAQLKAAALEKKNDDLRRRSSSSEEDPAAAASKLSVKRAMRKSCDSNSGFLPCITIGGIIRMVGIIFILISVFRNQDVLEFDIMNWIFMVVFSVVGFAFALAYAVGVMSGGRLVVIFLKTFADFAIMIAAIYSLVVMGAEAEYDDV